MVKDYEYTLNQNLDTVRNGLRLSKVLDLHVIFVSNSTLSILWVLFPVLVLNSLIGKLPV